MRRVATLLSVVGLLVAVVVSPAAADDRGDPVVDVTNHGEWFYFDPADELVMSSGIPISQEWCFGDAPYDNTMSSWLQDDGLWTSKVTDSGFPIYLYEGTVEDIIDGTCAGGPDPVPVAVGVGSSTATFTDQSTPWVGQGPPILGSYVENAARGTVTYADGSTAKLSGSVSYLVTEEGLAVDHLDMTVIPLS